MVLPKGQWRWFMAALRNGPGITAWLPPWCCCGTGSNRSSCKVSGVGEEEAYDLVSGQIVEAAMPTPGIPCPTTPLSKLDPPACSGPYQVFMIRLRDSGKWLNAPPKSYDPLLLRRHADWNSRFDGLTCPTPQQAVHTVLGFMRMVQKSVFVTACMRAY